MTDNDIIKALECCQSAYDMNCAYCDYKFRKPKCISLNTCESIMKADVLDLINRQKTEIERLEDDNQFLQDRRFKELSEVRDKAIKEFAERLKENAHDIIYGEIVTVLEIDNLVKEMEGERE